MTVTKYLSIFSPASKQQRQENFENYWQFTQQHGGELFEDDRDLAKNAPGLSISRTTRLNCGSRLLPRMPFTVIMSR